MTTLSSSALHTINHLQRQAGKLLLYQNVLKTEAGQTFLSLLNQLNQPEPNPLNCLHTYGHWFRTLANSGKSWSNLILEQILRDDNPFTQYVQRIPLAQVPAPLRAAAQQDLRTLQQLCQGQVTLPIDSAQGCQDQLSLWVQRVADLSEPPVPWTIDSSPVYPFTEVEDWGDALSALAEYYQEHGIGIFAQYRAIAWHSGELKGISYPDTVHLEELVGYEDQKQALLQNTESLLAGYPALNVLLYGSRGSGKSSLVKGLITRYRHLRLLEVSKSDLKDLPDIIERLRHAPQKFVIFVDDLSFEEDNDDFKSLKVVLEGNLTAKPQNVVVYATSNRRHLIREFFADRPAPREAEEVHAWDTMQEKLSFSDRFGLTLTFEPATQTTYLQMVHHLAHLAQIPLTKPDLEYQALQWATRHNGRSGRTARQFISFLQAQLSLHPTLKNQKPSPVGEGF